jgi:hypothetical protein
MEGYSDWIIDLNAGLYTCRFCGLIVLSSGVELGIQVHKHLADRNITIRDIGKTRPWDQTQRTLPANNQSPIEEFL